MSLFRFILILLVVFFCGCSNQKTDTSSSSYACKSGVADERFEHLIFTGPLTITEVKEQYQSEVAKYENEKMAKKWKEFNSVYSPNDCIFKFTSNEASWQSLSGVKGYAVVRGGKVIHILLTSIS